MTRRTRAVLVIVAVTIVAAVVYFVIARRNEPPNASATPAVALATVREGVVERRIAVSGRIGPAAGTQTKLAFAVPGTVRSVNVRLGEHVGSGAALAQIDPTSYSLAAQQAGADAQAAAANAAVAAVDRTSVKLRVDQAELQRQQRLYAAGVVALRDVQAAQSTVAADRAESQSAREQLTAAQATSRSAGAHAASTEYDLARTVLRAPNDGVITGIFVQPGEAVDAATAAVAFTPQAAGSATLDVPITDVAQIRPGDLVRARGGGRSFEGSVAGIATAVNPATGLAAVAIAGVPPDFAAGTPIDATIIVGRVRGLVLPRSAVVVDPQNGNTLVFVQTRESNGTVRFTSRVVTIDMQGDAAVRITSGVRAGERVAAQGGVDLLAPSGG